MIRVAIVEDNEVYKKALLTYLRTIEDLNVVYAGAGLWNFQELVLSKPDVVIMDIDLGKDSGIKGVHMLKEQLPESNVFILTVFEDEEKIFESIKAGAIGYLLKKDSPEKILEAIRNAYKGEGVMNGQIARKILNYFPVVIKKDNIDGYQLSVREREILLLLIDGLSYKEIAAKCFISIDTVNSHVRKIYSKLNVRSRSEISARFR